MLARPRGYIYLSIMLIPYLPLKYLGPVMGTNMCLVCARWKTLW